jgi:hypothetical protein
VSGHDGNMVAGIGLLAVHVESMLDTSHVSVPTVAEAILVSYGPEVRVIDRADVFLEGPLNGPPTAMAADDLSVDDEEVRATPGEEEEEKQ